MSNPASPAWVAFGLHGCLCHADQDRPEELGAPIVATIGKLNQIHAAGLRAKILTHWADNPRLSGRIQTWLQNYHLPWLEITSKIDAHMLGFFDTRVYRVVYNTGEVLDGSDKFLFVGA